MEQCKTCKHALYDEIWGEHKCKLSRHVMYPMDMQPRKCAHYEKGTVEKSKRRYQNYDDEE